MNLNRPSGEKKRTEDFDHPTDIRARNSGTPEAESRWSWWRSKKAKGMTAIARDAELGRESLYKAFAPWAKPRYDTVLKVLHSLGVKLNVTAA